jgi:hypothetical protein
MQMNKSLARDKVDMLAAQQFGKVNTQGQANLVNLDFQIHPRTAKPPQEE